MADQGYRIEIDHARHLVRATLDGHWDQTTAANFSRDLNKAFAEAAARSSPLMPRLLIDARNQGVQSQDVVTTAADHMSDFAGPRPRVAILLSSTLHKMQAARVASLDQQELFSSEDEALAFLLRSEDS